MQKDGFYPDIPQKKFNPGYDLVTRAVFYCARMLSAQCGTEFTPKNYDDIKKVYSIWICMDVPKGMEYTVSRYKMAKEDVHGTVPDEMRYDLLEVVMVCLVKDGILSKENAAERLDVAVEQLEEMVRNFQE